MKQIEKSEAAVSGVPFQRRDLGSEVSPALAASRPIESIHGGYNMNNKTKLRLSIQAIFALGALGGLWTWAAAQSDSRGVSRPTGALSRQDAATSGAAPAVPAKPLPLIREGTGLESVRGRFRSTGDTADFVDKEGRRFGGLRNLNLQRIIQALRASRNPEQLEWSVSGAVTEFEGNNYLLITRAIRRSPIADAGRRVSSRPLPNARSAGAPVDNFQRRNTMKRPPQ